MQDNDFHGNGVIIGKKEAQFLFVHDIIVCKQNAKEPTVKPLRMKVLEKVIENQINIQKWL